MDIVLVKDAALGSGTRPAGAKLATVSGVSWSELIDAAYAAIPQSLDNVPGTFAVAEGIQDREVFLALLNPQLLQDPSEPVAAAPSVDELGLTKKVVAALKAAGLETIEQVLTFGDTHDGLTAIEGIGEAAETQILEAIEGVNNA